jgi:hypothetical protein
MALTSVDLCSRALLKIGAHSIASFEEGTAEAEVAANLYAPTRDALMSSHPWNFAISQSELPRLAAAPLADYAFAFQIPADCIRVLSAGTGGQGSGLEYRVVGREVHADVENVALTYIRRVNEDLFPPFFASALVSELAAEFCIPLTDSTSRWEGLRRAAEAEFRRAKLIDAQEDTPPRIEDFTLIEERA